MIIYVRVVTSVPLDEKFVLESAAWDVSPYWVHFHNPSILILGRTRKSMACAQLFSQLSNEIYLRVRLNEHSLDPFPNNSVHIPIASPVYTPFIRQVLSLNFCACPFTSRVIAETYSRNSRSSFIFCLTLFYTNWE